jgi:uncharacterized cupredoxin-like copper-binding protein
VTQRSVLVASIGAVLAFAVGFAAFVALLSSSDGQRVNGAEGSASCSVPQLAGPTVDVTMSAAGDGMMSQRPMMATLTADPAVIPAGKVSFVATNDGALVHELMVLPPPADGPGTRPTGANGKIDESQSLDEASRSCGSGAGNGITPGSVGWVTMTLRPGRYELVCDQPWHYVAGMFASLTVRTA